MASNRPAATRRPALTPEDIAQMRADLARLRSGIERYDQDTIALHDVCKALGKYDAETFAQFVQRLARANAIEHASQDAWRSAYEAAKAVTRKLSAELEECHRALRAIGDVAHLIESSARKLAPKPAEPAAVGK